jgi:hypothetical protein
VTVVANPLPVPEAVPFPAHLSSLLQALTTGAAAARAASQSQATLVAEDSMTGVCASIVAGAVRSRDRGILAINLFLRPNPTLRRRARELLYRLALRNPRFRFTVCSGTQAGAYARTLRVSSARFALLPDCCPPGPPVWISPVNPRVAPDDGYVFIGGEAYRDWDTALEAARLANDVEFVFAAFSKRWRNPSVPANVTVRLDLSEDDFFESVARARVVVIPLLGEVTAGLLVLINAVLRGKLVIATRTSVTELYVPEDCRDVLVPLGEAGSLAAAIRRYCADDDERVACAIKCQDFVVTSHSAEQYTQALLDLIRQLDESTLPHAVRLDLPGP